VLRYGVYAVVLAILGGVAGWVVVGSGPESYGARAEILYQLDGERPTGFLRQDRQLSTQLVALRSRAVVQPVAEANDLTFDELSEALDVSVVQDSEVLRVQVRDRSPRRAQALAAGVADRYLERFRPAGTAEAREYLETQLREIDSARGEVSARLAQLGPAAGSSPSPEETRLQAELQSLLEQRDQVSERLDEVTVDELRAPDVELITESFVLDDPVAPLPERGAAGGAAAGLLVATGAIALLIRRRSPQPRDW
jgi:hypothetical protein